MPRIHGSELEKRGRHTLTSGYLYGGERRNRRKRKKRKSKRKKGSCPLLFYGSHSSLNPREAVGGYPLQCWSGGWGKRVMFVSSEGWEGKLSSFFLSHMRNERGSLLISGR